MAEPIALKGHGLQPLHPEAHEEQCRQEFAFYVMAPLKQSGTVRSGIRFWDLPALPTPRTGNVHADRVTTIAPHSQTSQSLSFRKRVFLG